VVPDPVNESALSSAANSRGNSKTPSIEGQGEEDERKLGEDGGREVVQSWRNSRPFQEEKESRAVNSSSDIVATSKGYPPQVSVE